jgi:8-amino-7-oxononanoate synthase
LIAATVRAALDIMQREPERREALHRRVAFAAREIKNKTQHPPSETQIQPIIVGSDITALALADELKARGFDIRAIRPPTVPEGTARLRLTITLNASEDDIRDVIAYLGPREAGA